MELISPIENFSSRKSFSQLFGVNYDLYNRYFNLHGHNGLDFVWRDAPKKGYGEIILAAHNGKAVRLYSDHPLQTRGSGIYLLSDDKKWLTVYWHLSEFLVKPNQEVKAGEKIGLAGNTGFVRPKPTKRNPYGGTHLHFGVKRLSHSSEYRGYVDPLPFMKIDTLPPQVCFPRNLWYGRSGDDVSWLQTILKLEKLAKDYEPIGFFGKKTQRDVIRLQKRYKIKPALGFCGPKTREFIHNKWTCY